MKKIIFITVLIFACSTTFGQDKKTDEVVEKWKNYFNKEDYKSAYDLYSQAYQQKSSLSNLTRSMKDVYGMMGKLKSIKFISYKDYVYKYIFYAKANQIEADVSIVVNKDGQLGYLNFDSIGGTGDPPPMAPRDKNR